MSSNKKRIVVKAEYSFIVWFEESNSWIQFEEPAYLIYKLFTGGTEIPVIYHKFSEHYGIPEPETYHFVDEIISGIKKVSKSQPSLCLPSRDIKDLTEFRFKPQYSHSYLINRKTINLHFENSLIGYYLHPLFSHLEIALTDKPDVSYEIFNFIGKSVLRNKKYPELNWSFEEINKLKRKLFVEISNIIYNKKESSWMSFIHASAVSDGNQIIMLSSDSGYGKSTLAAFLMKNGLQFVTDDFVPVDIKNNFAYPFPAAISLKKNSFHLFSDEYLSDLDYHGLKNSSVKFLLPEIKDDHRYSPKPVKRILFVRFDKNSSHGFKKLPVLKGLKLIFDQADVPATRKNARKFIKWFTGIECYQLEYSDIKWATKKVLGLFK